MSEECCKTLKEAMDCSNPECEMRKKLLDKIKEKLK